MPIKYHITADFLDALRTDGFVMGVGKHLHIQTLLQQLPDDMDAESLKLALIPLIAKTQQEQERFYEIFDACVKKVNERLPKTQDPSVSNDNNEADNDTNLRKIFNLPKILTLVFIALLLAIGGGIWWQNTHKPPVIENKNKTPDDVNTKIIPKTPSNTEGAPNPYFVDKKYPFPDHLEKYALKPPPPTQAWLHSNWVWLRWFLALVWLGLLLTIWWYRAWKRRKLVAQQDQNDKPPYIWNINIEGIEPIEMGNSLDKVTQVLRQRTHTDTLRMDIERTINATIEKGGLPNFKYKRQTRPTDYLLLIDRQSVRNHRAQLFDTLYHIFKAQEVEIARFFFDSDVRVCYSEDYPHGIALSDLQQRYYQSRLLIVGTGGQLLSPLSGKTAEWTKVFRQWKERVLFTPKPTKTWGYDERQLAALFTTLPATLQSLGFWVEEVDAGADARFETWQEKINDAPYAPITPDDNDPVPILDLYFEPDMLRWIAACAIYPTLHWDLTRWIGQQLANAGASASERVTPSHPLTTTIVTTPLSTFDNLMQLCRLPWFVTGEMPIETRTALLNWLEKTDKPFLLAMRGAIADELAKNPPPKDSAAFDKFKLNIALNQWLATTDAEKKKERETEISDLLQKGTEHDLTIIKYLNEPQTALHFPVPDAWRKYVYPAGYRALGWLKEFKDAWWLGVLGVLGIVGLFYPYSFEHFNCSNDRIVQLTIRDTTRSFCLDEPLSALTYQELLVHEAIEHRQFDSTALYLDADKTYYLNTTKLVNEVQIEDTTVQKLLSERNRNFAVDYYRLAHVYYKEGRKDSACLMLDKAVEYDSTDQDIQRARRDYCKIIISSDIVFEQDYEPYSVKDVYGYRHAKTKKTLIPPQYQDAHPFLEGLAAVKVNGQWGFIDTATRIILPPQYDYAYGFNEGMCLIRSYKNAYKHGYIDKTGRIVIPPQYAVASRFENGIATVKLLGTDKNSLCIDKTGKQVNCNTGAPIPPEQVPPSVNTPTTTTVNLPTNTPTTDIGGLKRPDLGTLENPNRQQPQQNIGSVIAPTVVDVKGGTFTMGCTKEQGSDCYDREKPAHQVTVNDFAIGKYEVTVEQFAAFIKDSGYKTDADKEGTSYVWTGTKGEDKKGVNWKCDVSGKIRPEEEYKHPVIHVSWNDATAYCQWLSSKTNKTYRLPTEAQWEYAARGGNQSKGFKYSGSNAIDEVAWYDKDGKETTTHIVGTKGANELGVHDMSGNVWEWCSDWYDSYSSSAVSNPIGATKGTNRVLRGGSWGDDAQHCRVSDRLDYAPTLRGSYVGFRVVCVP